MSIIDRISGDLLFRLSGGDSAASARSATPSTPLGLGTGASFDSKGVNLGVGLQEFSSAFQDSASRLGLAISGFQLTRARLIQLKDVTDDLLQLAKRSSDITLNDAERSRLHSEFQTKVTEFRSLLAADGETSDDVLDKTTLQNLLKDAGINLSAATRLAEIFSRLAADDGELGYSRIYSSDTAYTGPITETVGDGTFQARVSYAVGDQPDAIGVFDANSDGRQDIVSASAGDDELNLLLGNSDGTFQTAIDTAVGDNPSALAYGDLNADGVLDIVNTASNSDNIEVRLGNGNGTFQSAVTYSAGDNPSSVILADLDDDGILDVVNTSSGDNQLNIRLGVGDGTFSAVTSISAGNGATSVQAGDVDGDGVHDLLTVAPADNQINIFLGQGDGTFSAATAFAAGTSPQAAAFADVDGDDDLDAVVVGNNNVGVMLGDGTGAFAAPVNYAAGSDPRALFLSDLDGDDDIDIVETSFGDNRVNVLLGNGNGTFAARVSYVTGTEPTALYVTDISQDGAKDIVLAASGADSVEVLKANATSQTSIGSQLARANSSSDPLTQNLRSLGGSIIAYDTMLEFQKDVASDLQDIDALIEELRAARSFAISGLQASGLLAQRISSFVYASDLAEALTAEIRRFASDPQLAEHSDIDRQLAEDLLQA